MVASLEALPVELTAAILCLLDVQSLINTSNVCSRLRAIAGDPLLNPWKEPILNELLTQDEPESLFTLSVRTTVPRTNWIEIMCYAHPDFILFKATLANLTDDQWEEAFRRRFLPSWTKAHKGGRWREAFISTLFTVHHRTTTNCTTSEAWTNYMILRKNSANSCFASSRTFNPVAIFRDLKEQADLGHLETSVRLLVRLSDVQIIAFGARRTSSLFINPNAQALVNPPGVHPPRLPTRPWDGRNGDSEHRNTSVSSTGIAFIPQTTLPRQRAFSFGQSSTFTPDVSDTTIHRTLSYEPNRSDHHTRNSSMGRSGLFSRFFSRNAALSLGVVNPIATLPSVPDNALNNDEHEVHVDRPQPLEYPIMRHPTPHPSNRLYPNYTPPVDSLLVSDGDLFAENGVEDWRWYTGSGGRDESALFGIDVQPTKVWVGPMLLVAHLSSPHDPPGIHTSPRAFEEAVLTGQLSGGRWASFGWADLWAIAPWLKEKIPPGKRIDGEGLGVE